MNNNDDMIEILDDVNEENSTFSEPSNINANVQPQQPLYQQREAINQKPVNVVENQSEEVKYDPIENNKEEIKIEQESENEKSKSGLGFVIALFIIIGAFIFALPYIAKYFR